LKNDPGAADNETPAKKTFVEELGFQAPDMKD